MLCLFPHEVGINLQLLLLHPKQQHNREIFVYVKHLYNII